MMKNCWVVAAGVALTALIGWCGNVTATAITAHQRYPWNGLVDVDVTISGAANDAALANCSFAATNSATGVALAVSHITDTGTVSGSGTTWTRRFVWDAAADVGKVKIDDVLLNVEARPYLYGVQLWANGPYWAECNVGATKPEELGYYFWWGDTEGYKRNANNDGWVSVKSGKSYEFLQANCPTYKKTIAQLQSAGYTDSSGNLLASHDAARAHFGSPWRLPTPDERSAIYTKCTIKWTTRNGVYGRLVTGKGAYESKSIFLPAAGYGSSDLYPKGGTYGCYWTSTAISDVLYYSWSIYFDSSSCRYGESYRNLGFSVRAVR